MFRIHESSLILMYPKYDIGPPLLGLYTYSEVDKFSELLTEKVCHISNTWCLALGSTFM